MLTHLKISKAINKIFVPKCCRRQAFLEKEWR
jgi:hypothetical protein